MTPKIKELAYKLGGLECPNEKGSFKMLIWVLNNLGMDTCPIPKPVFLVAEQLYKRPRLSVCVSQIFTMIALVEALFFGSGSGVPLSQDVVTSNGWAWLSNAALRFCNLAEQCHNQIFYLGWAVPHSDFLAWLTSATLRFFNLGEQCHTQIY